MPADYWRIANSNLFDRAFYLTSYPDVARAGIDPILHYVLHGSSENRNPAAWFNAARYRCHHDLSVDQNPLVHYLESPPREPAPPPASVADVLDWQLRSDAIDVVPPRPPGDIGVFIHLFYDDLALEILERLANIPFPYRVYISTDTTAKRRSIETVAAALSISSRTIVKVLPNRGWDIGPFLVGFADEIRQHDICLKLHAKRSMINGVEFGAEWRRHLLTALVDHPVLVTRAVSGFIAHQDLGVMMPHHWCGVRDLITIGANFPAMDAMLARMDVTLRPGQEIEFPSGSMFWFRPQAIEPLLNLRLGWEDFEPSEEAMRDATPAHAIERIVLFSASRSGLRWALVPGAEALVAVCPEETISLIRESGEFDGAYYLAAHNDVAMSGWDPIEHYVRHGWLTNHDPAAHFDSDYYEKLTGCRRINVNPLLHYITIGKTQGLPTRAALL